MIHLRYIFILAIFLPPSMSCASTNSIRNSYIRRCAQTKPVLECARDGVHRYPIEKVKK